MPKQRTRAGPVRQRPRAQPVVNGSKPGRTSAAGQLPKPVARCCCVAPSAPLPAAALPSLRSMQTRLLHWQAAEDLTKALDFIGTYYVMQLELAVRWSANSACNASAGMVHGQIEVLPVVRAMLQERVRLLLRSASRCWTEIPARYLLTVDLGRALGCQAAAAGMRTPTDSNAAGWPRFQAGGQLLQGCAL